MGDDILYKCSNRTAPKKTSAMAALPIAPIQNNSGWVLRRKFPLGLLILPLRKPSKHSQTQAQPTSTNAAARKLFRPVALRLRHPLKDATDSRAVVRAFWRFFPPNDPRNSKQGDHLIHRQTGLHGPFGLAQGAQLSSRIYWRRG